MSVCCAGNDCGWRLLCTEREASSQTGWRIEGELTDERRKEWKSVVVQH